MKMKVVSVGNEYRIYDDTLKTMDKFPTMNYIVRFSPKSGFYLEKYSDIEINEKIYGIHESKVDKVIKAFNKTNKNLGVILSGNKGIGKSLFAKLLSIKAIDSGIPVIIVDKYVPGIANYIESIDQEIMVLFDEFDKTFCFRPQDGEPDPQVELLTLFDGIPQGKKMFVITCNILDRLNGYLVNRPGRFHYHFRFDYPKSKEIEEYLKDKLDQDYYDQIEKVIKFSKRVDLNFDCLRAIAFELNTGESFEEAIKDLNIINTSREAYHIILHFTNGNTLRIAQTASLDLFSSDTFENVYIYDTHDNYVGDMTFNVSNVIFDPQTFKNIIKGENLNIDWDEEDGKKYSKLKVDYAEIIKKRSDSIHYTV